MSLLQKYLFKVSQGCDAAIMALQVIKGAPDKAFEGDLNARIEACESIIRNVQNVKRYLFYFKNRRQKLDGDLL
jgi:hypothetical protein